MTDKYMYDRDATWKIGSSTRGNLNNNEIYDYF